MSIFGKKKKPEEEVKTTACCCNGACSANEAEPEAKTDTCCQETKGGISRIKILGSGCKSCHTLYENTLKAVADMGLVTEVEYITDLQKIMTYGVMSMPALVVDEKVVAMGKVYKSEDIEKLLHKLGF